MIWNWFGMIDWIHYCGFGGLLVESGTRGPKGIGELHHDCSDLDECSSDLCTTKANRDRASTQSKAAMDSHMGRVAEA